MSWPAAVAVAVGSWVLLVALGRVVCRALERGPGADAVRGLAWMAMRAYCRIVHRAAYRGLEHVPTSNRPGGLIVVCNHTSPVDPLLIQAACRFEIRWMMAADMMTPDLQDLWRWSRAIPVARTGTDVAAAREAIRHVRGGGVLGIFPEGGIVRPAGEIRPFAEGVGLIVARTAAPVLLVFIRGTPQSDEMVPALLTRSRAEVRFIGILSVEDRRDPRSIAAQLRRSLADASGWRLSGDPLRPASARSDALALSG